MVCRMVDPPHTTSFFCFFHRLRQSDTHIYPPVDMNIPQEVVGCGHSYGVYPRTWHFDFYDFWPTKVVNDQEV